MNIFDVDGRIGRMGYFFWMLGIAFLVAVANVIIEANVYRAEAGTFALVYIVAWVLTIFPMVNRLHDLNRSGWVCLLSLIPLVNLGLGLYLLFGRSYDEKNEYGAPPQKLRERIKDKLPARSFSLECSDNDTFYQQASAGRLRTEKPIKITRSDSDVFFQKAMEELEEDRADKALWAKIFAQTGGDENKAKALYIKMRAEELGTQDVERKAELLRKESARKAAVDREVRRKADVKRLVNELEAALKKGAYVRASATVRSLEKLDPGNALLTSEKVSDLPKQVEVSKNKADAQLAISSFKFQAEPIFDYTFWDARIDKLLKKLKPFFVFLPDEDVTFFKKKVSVLRENGVKKIKRNRLIYFFPTFRALFVNTFSF